MVTTLQIDPKVHAARRRTSIRTSPTSPINNPLRYWSSMASDRESDTKDQRGRAIERDIALPNPVSLFDYHLKGLDNYVAFFQDR